MQMNGYATVDGRNLAPPSGAPHGTQKDGHTQEHDQDTPDTPLTQCWLMRIGEGRVVQDFVHSTGGSICSDLKVSILNWVWVRERKADSFCEGCARKVVQDFVHQLSPDELQHGSLTV